jgi:periplasmic copper chaperone A
MRTPISSLLVLVIWLTACTSAKSTPVASSNGIEISDAWVRLPGGAMAGMNGETSLAGYMTIKNSGKVDDRLIGVQADFADMAMLHESITDANGIATMKEVPEITIPAGQTVALKPGGFHLMFTDPKPALKVGDSVKLSLQFEQAGTITIPLKVMDQ